MQDPARRRYEDYNEEPKAKKEINPLILAIGSVILSLIIVYVVMLPNAGTPKAEVQKQIDASSSDAKQQLTDLSNKLTKQFNDQVTSTAQSVNDAKTTANQAKSTADSLKNSVDTANNSSNQAQKAAEQAQKSAEVVNSNINQVKSDYDSKISSINTKITDTNTSIDALKKQITDLTAKVNTTPTPTQTNTGTGSASNGQVTATIVSYSSTLYNGVYFNNSNANSNGILSITPSLVSQYGPDDNNSGNHPNDSLVRIGNAQTVWWANKNSTAQFQLQINNNTGKTISNIQMSLGFVFIKSDGTQINVPYSPDGAYNLSSMGNPQWTNTGSDASYTSWATGASNSILASIWNFNQQPGTSTYYSTFTYTLPTCTNPNSPLPLPATTIYAVPLLKVVGYN